MVNYNGTQNFIPADNSLPREYVVYRNYGKEQAYLGSTYANNVREALKLILALKFRIESEGLEIDANEIDDGVWQLWVGEIEYIVKIK